MANKPNNPALWSRAKSLAKQKFDVYPSAYANGWAAKWYKGKGGSWRKAEYGMEVMGDGGAPNNAGFNALPLSVQQKIMDNMAQGGEKMPAEIARARFAAAGNLDQMDNYGYAYGGYSPEMMYGGKPYMQQGGQQEQIMQIIQAYAQMSQVDPEKILQQLQKMSPEEQQKAFEQMTQAVQQGGAGSQQSSMQQPNMQQAAMRYGGYMTGMFAEGGEPNGGMALGQISAVADKMNKLREFVSPDQNLDPWIASKLAVIDDSTAAIADYMMYNPEAQEGMMEEGLMPEMGGGGYTVTRSNDRKGKTHKVTGPGGVVKYFGDSNLGQHPGNPKRKAAFYARHKKNLAGNPFFRAFARKTWQNGGQPDYSSILDQNAADAEKYPSAYHKDYATGYPVANSAGSIPRPGGFDCPPGYTKYKNPDGTFSCIMTNPAPGSSKVDFSRMTKMADDMQFSRPMQPPLASAPIRKNGGSTFSGNAWYGDGGGYIPEYAEMAYGGNTNQYGGLAEGDILDVTPEELQMLKQGGYNFEIIK